MPARSRTPREASDDIYLAHEEAHQAISGAIATAQRSIRSAVGTLTNTLTNLAEGQPRYVGETAQSLLKAINEEIAASGLKGVSGDNATSRKRDRAKPAARPTGTALGQPSEGTPQVDGTNEGAARSAFGQQHAVA